MGKVIKIALEPGTYYLYISKNLQDEAGIYGVDTSFTKEEIDNQEDKLAGFVKRLYRECLGR